MVRRAAAGLPGVMVLRRRAPEPPGRKVHLLSSATLLVLLSIAFTNAAEISIHSIATNPTSFDRQAVTLEGTAIAVKETTSRRGNDYTTFKLQDPGGGDSISLFTWGHPPLGNGDHVRVEGVFEREHHQGRYTFYNEVEATKVTPLPQ